MTLASWLLVAALAADPLPFHTELQATYPAADSVHASEIREVRLRFSTAVQLALSTVSVFGPEGVLRSTDSLRYAPGSQDRELSLALDRPLTTGDYRVEWRTAGPDGHALRGEFAFRVRWEPPADTTRPAATEAPPPSQEAEDPGLVGVADGGQAASGGRLTGAAARWLLYLTLAVGLGGALFRTVVLPRVGSDDQALAVRAAMEKRMIGLAWVGVAAGAVALPLALGVQSVQAFGGGGLAPASLGRVLASPWGEAWLLQAAAVALLAGGLMLGRRWRPRWGWLVAGTAGVLLAAGLARAGHAAQGGTVPVTMQALHAAAAATWLGGLVILVLVALPVTRKHEGFLSRVVDAFSPMALAAVAVLVASGAFNSWDRLGGPSALFTSSFGRVLALKLLLFGAAAALGFHNWRTVRPALRQESRPGLLRVPVSLEMLLGLAVLAVTAALVAMPLP